jgi:ribose transport system substrate-binding protein
VPNTRRGALAIAVLTLVTGLLAGCGGRSSGPRSVEVAYLATSLTTSYATALATGFEDGVGQVPGTRQTVVAPPDNDSIRQVAMLKSLLQTTHGLTYSSAAPEETVTALAAAARHGLPLVALDIPPAAGSGVTLFVGNDNHELGVMLADLVIAQLPAGATGTVLLGNPRPGLPVLDLRALAVREEFARRLPGVTVKGPFDTSVHDLSNEKSWHQLLAANPTTLAVLSVGADGATIAKIRSAAHATWRAGAFDIDPESLAAVKAGDLVLVSPEHFLKGAVAGRLTAEAATGRRALPHGWIDTPGLAITGQNVDAITAREASLATRVAWVAPELDKILAGGSPAVRPLGDIR